MKSIFTTWTFMIFYFSEFGNVELKSPYNTFPLVITRATPFQPTVISKTCQLKPERGPCRANINMYYFDPTMMTCSRFRWGGCQGNGNRFDTKFQCEDTCLSKPNVRSPPPKWCSLTFDYGFCFGAITRWYYDRMWKVCKKTIYSGCGGNKNNFYSQDQCESVCRFGKGPMTFTTSASGNSMKVLIVNPWNATPPRKRINIISIAASINNKTMIKAIN